MIERCFSIREDFLINGLCIDNFKEKFFVLWFVLGISIKVYWPQFSFWLSSIYRIKGTEREGVEKDEKGGCLSFKNKFFKNQKHVLI